MCDDDPFQGDNFDERNNQAKELDLFAVSNTYKDYWKLPEHSAMHDAIVLFIAKGMSYDNSNQIIAKIHKKR